MLVEKKEIKIVTTNIALTSDEAAMLKNIVRNRIEKYTLSVNEESFLNDLVSCIDNA